MRTKVCVSCVGCCSGTRLSQLCVVAEIDQALKEYNAMELFQAKEMVRYAAAGRAEEYRVKEWMGRYLESATRSNAVGYWGGDEWYMRDPGDWWW